MLYTYSKVRIPQYWLLFPKIVVDLIGVMTQNVSWSFFDSPVISCHPKGWGDVPWSSPQKHQESHCGKRLHSELENHQF